MYIGVSTTTNTHIYKHTGEVKVETTSMGPVVARTTTRSADSLFLELSALGTSGVYKKRERVVIGEVKIIIIDRRGRGCFGIIITVREFWLRN